MKRPLLLFVASVLIVALLWVYGPVFFGDGNADRPGNRLTEGGRSTGNAAGSGVAETRSDLADSLNVPESDIRADLRVVANIVETFRSNFPREGNPVGNNAEITAALLGRNRLRLSLIPPDHPAINRGGELCDRWGTPFFFHAESGRAMSIRSAGPDRKMWNEDDVVHGP